MPPKPKVKFPCLKCGNTTNNTNSVECIVCKCWTHKDCDAEIDEKTWEFINHMKKTKGHHFWACMACSVSQKKFDTLVKKLSEDVEELKEKVQDHEERIDSVDDQSQANAKQIEENTSEIAALKEQVESTLAPEIPEKRDVIQAVVKELRDAEERRSNVIIHGIKEPSNLERKARTELETKTVRELFEKIKIDTQKMKLYAFTDWGDIIRKRIGQCVYVLDKKC